MQVKGLKELQMNINLMSGKTLKGVKEAVNFIYQESQGLVPVDTGRLKQSGRISRVLNGYRIRYKARNPETGYNYAPIQHENLDFHHKFPTQAKYLSQPIITHMGRIKKMIVKESLR